MSSSSSVAAERRLSVFLLIRALNLGGAERQLISLATGMKKAGHKVTVAVYYRGVLDDEIEAAGVRLIDLRKKGRWDLATFTKRLVREVRDCRPDVVYSFLGTSNILTALIAPFARIPRLVWSVRASNMDTSAYDWASSLSYRLECALSGRPDLIISNSQAGVEHAAQHGFPRERMIVIPNGIDTNRFRPDREAGAGLRRAWGVADDETLVGVLARIDPMKDHATFLRAAARLAAQRPELRFICVGTGFPQYTRELQSLADSWGLAGRLMWPGPLADPVAALNAFDICCSSSSWGEGFSNAVAEAMACGTPCVVTDVGDSRLIVGDLGRVVTPGDDAALATAVADLIPLLGSELSGAARSRIVDNFSIERLVSSTAEHLAA